MTLATQDLHSAHSLQPYWDLQLAGLGADALQLAIECQLFNRLQDYQTPRQVAADLAMNESATGYFLELLWSLGMLERDGQTPERYRNHPTSEQYLRSDANDYCGDALLFRQRMLRQTGSLLSGYLYGSIAASPATTQDVAMAWANAARLQIAQEQRAVTTQVACALVERLPEYAKIERLLDLGGGPGLVAIALAESQPRLQGVVFEYPATAEVAQKNIRQAGLEHRLKTVGGDLNHDEIGSGFDLIWCSSVLHFVDDLEHMLQRLHTALRPGGVLICCQAEVPDQLQAAARVLPYYLHMRLQGRHVLAHGELAKRLRQTGFSSVEQFDEVRFPVTPVSAVIARKTQE